MYLVYCTEKQPNIIDSEQMKKTTCDKKNSRTAQKKMGFFDLIFVLVCDVVIHNWGAKMSENWMFAVLRTDVVCRVRVRLKQRITN